ncbi:hypothetical protein [Brevibacillus parabrevis]|nr:hypothetical protein [Brevibacillus parabrevis]
MTKLEMFRIELDPGASYLSTPHNEGVYDYITVSKSPLESRHDQW